MKLLKLFGMPMDDELKWLLNKGGEYIFESCDINLENTPTSHPVSLALCMHAVILQWLYAMCLLMQEQKIVFVSPSSSCTTLLHWCFFLNIIACTEEKIGGHSFERKTPFCNYFIQKKGVGLFLRVALFFGRLKIHLNSHIIYVSETINFTVQCINVSRYLLEEMWKGTAFVCNHQQRPAATIKVCKQELLNKFILQILGQTRGQYTIWKYNY